MIPGFGPTASRSRGATIVGVTVALCGAMLVANGNAAGAAIPQAPESARQLLQRAIHLEEAIGNPEAAIASYERAFGAPDADAPLAAVAEFRLAVLLSRVGRVEEALAHHRRIVTNYAMDPRLGELVRLARAVLGDELRIGVGNSMVARRLLEGSDAYAFGALSPDGSFISFVDTASGSLAIHDLDRGFQRAVTDLGSALDSNMWRSSVVSPDGRSIAYTRSSPETGCEIRIISVDGSEERTVLTGWMRPRQVELKSWSTDGGDLLAVVDVDETTHELVLISIEDGSIRVVAELGATASVTARLSPDGRWIAYHHRDDDGTHDILLIASDGSVTTKLVDHPANDLLPIWTTDGRHVLFVSDRTGTLAAWVVQVGRDGRRRREPQLVKPDFGRSIPLGFADHGALVYAQQISLDDIYTATIDPQTGAIGERVAIGSRFVGVNRSPALSADGRRMVYLSDRGMLPAGLGPTILVVRDLETGQEHSPAPDLRRVLAPRWHPDGRNLVVEALDPDSRWGIYTIDVDTAAVEPMVTWDRPSCGCAAAPALSPDGRFLAYYRPQLQEGKGDLVLRNVDSREETVLMMGASPANVRALSFAPDGTVLAAAIRRGDADQPASWILEFISLTTGERRDITTLGTSPQGVDVIGWTADGSGALYVRADDDRHSLGWAGTDGVTRILVDELPRDLRDIRLHPRDDRLVFSAGRHRAEIWMLENPLATLSGTR